MNETNMFYLIIKTTILQLYVVSLWITAYIFWLSLTQLDIIKYVDTHKIYSEINVSKYWKTITCDINFYFCSAL